jgi:hypothetical protein
LDKDIQKTLTKWAQGPRVQIAAPQPILKTVKWNTILGERKAEADEQEQAQRGRRSLAS